MAELTANPWLNTDADTKTKEKPETKIKETTESTAKSDNKAAQNHKQNDKHQKNKGKKRKNKKRKKNKKQHKKIDHSYNESYSLRDRKSINYRNAKTQPINAGYDTDEELNKLFILQQQYPGFDSDDDCDLEQDQIVNNSPNTYNTNNAIQKETETNENDTQNESKSDMKTTSDPVSTKSDTKECNKEQNTCIEIDPKWDYDELMANKQLLFGCKYRWNFCSSYFPKQTLDHVYSASWPKPSAMQYAKYDAMLKECIKTVTKYHRKTMDEKLREEFERFSDQYSIQFSDSILMFTGMTEASNNGTIEKGRSVRVGFFKKNNCEANDDKANEMNTKLKLLVVYADNKQFVAESQQFFGLQIGDFVYESRKWALSEDAAYSEIKGNKIMNEGNIPKWMNIALIVGVSIINRLLNPSLPDKHRMNSIYQQELFDVTDLLPPFDDLQNLLDNDKIWWLELQKRIERGSNAPSDGSSLEGSLKDFIDDTVDEAPVNIQNALKMNQHDAKHGEDGMLNEYLLSLQHYNKEMDKTYEVDYAYDDDEDYEKFIDESIVQDVKNLMEHNEMNVDNAANTNKNVGSTTNVNNDAAIKENINKKRDINEMEKECNVLDKDYVEPPTKKQKV